MKMDNTFTYTSVIDFGKRSGYLFWFALAGLLISTGNMQAQTNDLQMQQIITPGTFGCDYAAAGGYDSMSVKVRIRNAGTQPQSNFLVYFRIFNIVPTGLPETVSQTILPGQTLDYTFRTKVLIDYPDFYSFAAWVKNPGDNNATNDTLKNHPVIVAKPVDKMPFIERFDIGIGGTPVRMYNDPLTDGEDWQFGASAQGITNDRSGNGYFAYVDNRTPHSQAVHLMTPCMDFTGMFNPHMEFYLWNSGTNITLYVDVYSNGQWFLNYNQAPFGNQPVSDWVFKEVNLAPFAGQVVKVRFRASEVGTTSTPDLGIDEIKVYDLPPINLSMVSVEAPISGCGLTDIEAVSIKFEQLGFDTLRIGDVVQLWFQIDNGPVTHQVFAMPVSVGRNQTYTHTFQAPGNFSQVGEYKLKIWSYHPLDTDKSNDTIEVVIDHVPSIANYPYTEDFRFGRGGWTSGGLNNSWGFGEPKGQVISIASKGANAWMTGHLMGPYSNNEQSYVESPCYDFSSILRPQLSMDVWWDVQTNSDGAAVLYTIDNGQNWARLGAMGNPLNWYNYGTILGSPGGQGQGWTGNGASGSLFWRPAKLNMPNLAGMPQVRFRVVFGSNATINNFDGFAFDNVSVGEAPIITLPDSLWDCGYVILDPGLGTKGKFFWSNGARTPVLIFHNDRTVAIEENIVLYYEDESGLYATDTVYVNLQPGPYVNLGEDRVVCGQTDYILDAGNPGLQYLWENNTTNRFRTVTASGTYSVTVFSSVPSVCVKSDQVTLTFSPNPEANFNVVLPDSSIHRYNFTNSSTGATEYFWDFGDSIYSTQSNPVHFYHSKGTYTVMLIVTNECGSDTSTTTINVGKGVGIDRVDFSDDLTVYPNPNSGHFTVAWNNATHAKAEMMLMDVLGRMVWQETVYPDVAQSWQKQFSVNVAPGIYRLLVFTNGGVASREVVVTR